MTKQEKIQSDLNWLRGLKKGYGNDLRSFPTMDGSAEMLQAVKKMGIDILKLEKELEDLGLKKK